MISKRILMALALVLVATSASAWDFWYSAYSESDSVSKSAETKTFKHSLNEKAEGTTMKVRLNLNEGEALVTLLDPSGATKFQRSFRKGKSSVEENFEAVGKGQWQLRVAFKGATGRYTFKLVDY